MSIHRVHIENDEEQDAEGEDDDRHRPVYHLPLVRDLWLEIFILLPLPDATRMRRVCKKFRDWLSLDDENVFWRNYYHRMCVSLQIDPRETWHRYSSFSFHDRCKIALQRAFFPQYDESDDEGDGAQEEALQQRVATCLPWQFYGDSKIEAMQLFMKADYFRKRSEFEKALKELRTAISMAPYSAKLRFVKGRCHFELSELPKAIHSFSSAIALDPNYCPAFYYRARAFYRSSRFEVAMLDVERLLSCEDCAEEQEHLMLKALICVDLKRFEAAKELYSKLIVKSDYDTQLKLNYCWCLLKMKQFEEAETILSDQLLSKDYVWNALDSDVELLALHDRARLYMNLSLWDLAINDLNKTRLRSEDRERIQLCLCDLGWAKMKARRFNEALKDLENPAAKSTTALVTTSRIYWKLNKPEEAMRYAKRASATDSFGKAQLARVLFKQNHLDESLREVEKCFKGSGAAEKMNAKQRRHLYYLKGRVLFELQRFEEAVDAFEIARDLKPHDPKYREWLLRAMKRVPKRFPSASSLREETNAIRELREQKQRRVDQLRKLAARLASKRAQEE